MARRLALFIALTFALAAPVDAQSGAVIYVDVDCSLFNAFRSAQQQTLLAPMTNCEAGSSGKDRVVLTADVVLPDGPTVPYVTTEIDFDGQGYTISSDPSALTMAVLFRRNRAAH